MDPVLQQKCAKRSLRSDPTQPRPAIVRGFFIGLAADPAVAQTLGKSLRAPKVPEGRSPLDLEWISGKGERVNDASTDFL